MIIRLIKDEMYPVYIRARGMNTYGIEYEVPSELWELYQDTFESLVSLGQEIEEIIEGQ